MPEGAKKLCLFLIGICLGSIGGGFLASYHGRAALVWMGVSSGMLALLIESWYEAKEHVK